MMEAASTSETSVKLLPDYTAQQPRGQSSSAFVSSISRHFEGNITCKYALPLHSIALNCCEGHILVMQ
jgi:hypothetical protein